MLPEPTNLDKYLYIRKTPTWMVRAVFGFGLLSWLIVVLEFVGAIVFDPLFRFFIPLVIGIVTYEVAYLVTNLFYKRFDLNEHQKCVEEYWQKNSEPSVDVFLPICGEDNQILRNTWTNVLKLDYKNKRVFVLDDSRDDVDVHKKMAAEFGFTHLERPNKGEMKKAGNLRYGFLHSVGEFIAVLDADFAPHRDFLRETIPHTKLANVAIVQTPQFFYMPKEASAVSKRSGLEYGAAYTQEDFYRIGQVARDRLGGALCCGTSAIYRRAALETIGGPLQVDKSEDSRTGFALVSKGWDIKYLPVILSAGMCPDNIYGYFHQQHRWASGRTELTLSKEFLAAPVSLKKKFCYITGFLFYLQHPLAILFTFQLFYTLIRYHYFLSAWNIIPYLPYLVFWYLLMPIFRILPFRFSSFYAGVVQAYTHAHAVFTAIRGRSVAWVSTGARHGAVSLAFKQTVAFVATYFFLYLSMLALAIRTGSVRVFDPGYYSVEFWIVWNIVLSSILLWQMYAEMLRVQREALAKDSDASILVWQLKTAGLYSVVLAICFLSIAYLY